MKEEITIEIKKPEIIILLLLLLVVFVLELQVTFSSPIAFGDEGFHTRIAQYIAQEKEYPVWNPFEGTKLTRGSFSRAPLWNLLEGGFFFLFGFHESIVKVLTPFIATILTGFTIFILGKKLYNEKVGFLAALLVVTIPSFVTYSVLFYTDILFTFYFSLFVLTFILAIKSNERKYWILSGIFGAFSFLTKTPGIAIFPLIGLGLLYQLYKQKTFIKPLKNYVILGLFLVLIIGPFILRNLAYYRTPYCALPLFDESGCKKIFEYKSGKEFEGRIEQVGTNVNMFKMGIVNYLFFAYGNVWFAPLLVFCGLIFIVLRKKETDILLILALLSFLPIFYFIIFGRAEDVARYTLGILCVFALIIGTYLKGVCDTIKKYNQWLALIVFILVIILGFLNFKEKLGTMSQVKQFSPSFFEACNFIKQNVSEDALLMTVWDHQTIYNCQRDVTNFSGLLPDRGDILLSSNLSLSLTRMQMHGITHIFVQKFSISPKLLRTKYPVGFIQFLEDNPDTFIKVYENGPSVSQCLQTGNCDGNILYGINYISLE